MPSMYEIYRNHRDAYDRLVAAEDHARHLPACLNALVDWRGLRVLEGGTGTGRVTEFYIEPCRQAVCLEREPHMLEAARERLAAHAPNIDFLVADNLALPRLPETADLFIEGWSWGHSILDAPGSVEATADALFANVRKSLVPGAPVLLIETLGTNALAPAAPHPRLAEFYQILQSRYGLHQTVLSTDYRFPSVQEAADILGFFFGPAMEQAIRFANSPVIPEWTGVWHGPLPAPLAD